MNSYHHEMDENNMLGKTLAVIDGRYSHHRGRWFNGTPNRALFFAVPDHEAPR